MKTITEEEFLETFKPMKNHFQEQDCKEYVAFAGCMFEPFGKELEYVTSMAKQNRIWTIIDTDDMLHYYTRFSTGMHLDRRIGYFVCEVPYIEQMDANIDPFATSDQVHQFLADYGTMEKVNDENVLVEWEGKRCFLPDTNTPIKDFNDTFTNNEIWDHLITASNLTPWDDHLDKKYGKEGTPSRNKYEEEFESFKIGVLIQDARKSRI